MTLLLVAALALPLAAAVVYALVSDHVVAHRVGLGGVLVASACWAWIATDPDAFALGRVRPDSLGPLIAIGVLLPLLTLLDASGPPSLATAGALAASSVLAALGNLGDAPATVFAPVGPPPPGAVTALAVTGLAVAMAVGARTGSLIDVVLLGASGAAAVAAVVMAGDDALTTAPAVAIAVAVGGVAVAASRRENRGAVVLVPIVLASVARVTAGRVVADEVEPVATVLAAAAAAGALWVAVRDPRPVRSAAGPVALLAAAFTMVPSVDDARSTGLLLAAGAVLVAVGARRIVMVAAGPGAIGAVVVLGRSDASEALILIGFGAVTAVALLLGALADERPGWTVADVLAVGFAVVPAAWTWSGVPGLEQVDDSLLLVAAAGGIGGGFASVVHLRRTVRRAAARRPDAGSLPGSPADDLDSADPATTT